MAATLNPPRLDEIPVEERLPRSFGAIVYDEQRLVMRLREDRHLYEGLRELLYRRREARREQLEGGEGEKAIMLRGRAQELTSLLNEVFPPITRS